MANSKTFRFIISCVILMLSVETMKFSTASAKKCTEGMVDITQVICTKGLPDQPCVIACQQRHGPEAEAWCSRLGLPGAPINCLCDYPC